MRESKSIRISAYERSVLEAAARRTGQAFSGFVREAALDRAREVVAERTDQERTDER